VYKSRWGMLFIFFVGSFLGPFFNYTYAPVQTVVEELYGYTFITIERENAS
jgi:hypothetical protein